MNKALNQKKKKNVLKKKCVKKKNVKKNKNKKFLHCHFVVFDVWVGWVYFNTKVPIEEGCKFNISNGTFNE